MPTAEKDSFTYSLDRLNRKAYTISEMRKKLSLADFSEVEIEDAIHRCMEYNYLNDQRFADSFIHDKQSIKRWGRLKIIRELNKRGITDFNNASFDNELELVNLNRHLQAKLAKAKLKKTSRNELMHQLYQFLYYKGFEPEQIHVALNGLEWD